MTHFFRGRSSIQLMSKQSSTGKRARARGFSLVELMVVVATVSILGAVVVPKYLQYQLRSKTAEALVIIGAIRVSQEGFVAEFNDYANIYNRTPSNAPHHTKIVWPTRVCPASCRHSNTGQCREFSCIGFKPAGPTYFDYRSPNQLRTATRPPDFCIEAETDLDADGRPKAFEYQSDNGEDGRGNYSNCFFDDGGACQRNSSFPEEIIDCDPGTY